VSQKPDGRGREKDEEEKHKLSVLGEQKIKKQHEKVLRRIWQKAKENKART
jgi:hypothetical protein